MAEFAVRSRLKIFVSNRIEEVVTSYDAADSYLRIPRPKVRPDVFVAVVRVYIHEIKRAAPKVLRRL